MKPNFFICFTGIDGTGKTTLSKKLIETLGIKGIECQYVYGRLRPIISKPFMVIGRKIFLNKSNNNYDDYSENKKATLKSYSVLANLYQQILLLDYIFQVLIKIKIPLFMGKNVVCDRYIYDTLITDISIDMNYSMKKNIQILKKMFHIIPKPNLVFLINIPEQIAYERKDDIPSLKYLVDRNNLYLTLGKECSFIILDGQKSQEGLICEIINELTKKKII
jgi:thymidylate kinase